MKLTLHRLGDLRSTEIERWHELAATAVEPNPFFEPDYLLPLARSLGALADVSLAVLRDEWGEWVACMPVQLNRGWHRIPLPALAAWRGRGLLPALVGTPLIASACAEQAAVTLATLAATHAGASFMAFDGLVEGGPVEQAIRTGVGEQGLWSLRFSRERRAFLRCPSGDERGGEIISKKHRRNLRSQWRRLSIELGGELEVVELGGDPRAVSELVELEGRSTLAARGSALRSDPAQAAFFADMCAAFAARGRLQLLSLQAAGRQVAMKCSLLADPGVFYLKIAYDEAYSRFSPGTQLELAAQALLRERPQSAWIDSCAFPDNDTCNRLLPDRRVLVSLAVAERRLGNLAAIPLIRSARLARDRAMARAARESG